MSLEEDVRGFTELHNTLGISRTPYESQEGSMNFVEITATCRMI